MASQNSGKICAKPEWLKIRLPLNKAYARVASIVKQHDLHTICSSGACPNMSDCWARGTATFMIAGDICTRSCRFCATCSGKPAPLDANEPIKIARSIRIMELKHCVITSVDRDDLPDGGAAHWVATVRAINELCPNTTVEILIPDFDGRTDLLDMIVDVNANIVGHNMETVRRISPTVRSRATYNTSLDVLSYLSSKGVQTKSGIMVGIGETDDEVRQTIDDLIAAGVLRLTIGQYLQPTRMHMPVEKYIDPDKFEEYKKYAISRGMKYVQSAPLVRSSFHAEQGL